MSGYGEENGDFRGNRFDFAVAADSRQRLLSVRRPLPTLAYFTDL